MRAGQKAESLMTVVFLCLFLLCSCSLSGTGSESLRYPRMSDEEKAIYSILSKHTEGNYNLAYAKRGQYQNPVLYRDLDGDGESEILVSYLPGQPTERYVRTLILKPNGKKSFRVISSINGLSDSVDRVEFSDFDGDGIQEVIIGYGSLTDNYPSTLSIFRRGEDSEVYTSAYITDYYDFVCIDFDSDGKEELLHINYSELSHTASALIIIYNSETDAFTTVTGGAALAYSTKCYRIQKSRTADGAPAVYITAKNGSILKSTETVIWNYDYSVPQNISLTNAANIVSKDYLYYGNLLAQDIDRDGIMEFPVSVITDEEKITKDIRDAVNRGTMEIPQYSYSWYYVSDGYPVYDFSCYVNAELNYYVKIDNPTYFDNVSVFRNSAGNLLFYRNGGDGSRLLLFSLTAASSAPQNAADTVGYISENGTYIVYMQNPSLTEEQKTNIISAEELKTSLYVTGILTVSED